MEIKILEEAGHQWALAGTSLSFKDESIPFDEWWTEEKYNQMKKTCKGMAFKDGGHNKFLESMQLWIFIKAPRGWWQEFDTYRVGTTKNSASKMLKDKDLQRVKWNIPEGFLQSRIVNTNYKVLRNMFLQRWTHRLEQWQFFINSIKEQCKYPDYLPSKIKN